MKMKFSESVTKKAIAAIFTFFIHLYENISLWQFTFIYFLILVYYEIREFNEGK